MTFGRSSRPGGGRRGEEKGSEEDGGQEEAGETSAHQAAPFRMSGVVRRVKGGRGLPHVRKRAYRIWGRWTYSPAKGGRGAKAKEEDT